MLFQQFAQENNINIKKLHIGEHPIKRARERFSGYSNLQEQQVIGNIRALLKNSIYIGEIIDEQNKLSHMFAAEKRAIYLSDDFKKVNTVMVHAVLSYNPIKKRMLELHQKELRKLTRKENARIRYLSQLKDDCDVDLALLKRRINRTRSSSVKMASQAKIEAIHKSIREYEEEIKSIQDEKRLVSRSLVSVL